VSTHGYVAAHRRAAQISELESTTDWFAPEDELMPIQSTTPGRQRA
jgi:hypothetical protein